MTPYMSKFNLSKNNEPNKHVVNFSRIMSEIIDSALNDETQSGTSESSVFRSILRSSNLDMKEKIAVIIDFIAAGIKTVIIYQHTAVVCQWGGG